LRRLNINRANQVWSADITYIPMGRGFAYLVAIMDWHSRAVLGWRISNTLDTDFCVEALHEGVTAWIHYYNHERYHQSLDDETPWSVWQETLDA
jgi:transposase InsO family protein